MEKCAELAFDKGYKHFTLGNKGLCLSGEDVSQRYYGGGAVDASKCKQGIGIKGAMYAYTFGKEFNLTYKVKGIFKKSARQWFLSTFALQYLSLLDEMMIIITTKFLKIIFFPTFKVSGKLQNAFRCRVKVFH